MLQMLHKCPDRIKQKIKCSKLQIFPVQDLRREKTEKNKTNLTYTLHEKKKNNVSCNGRQDVKSHLTPQNFFCTLNHLQKWEKEKRKKKSVINLYIQIQLGSKPKLHYLMLYTCISPFIFKVKPSLSPQQKKKFFFLENIISRHWTNQKSTKGRKGGVTTVELKRLMQTTKWP